MFPMPKLFNTSILPPPAPSIDGIFTSKATKNPERWAFGYCVDSSGYMYCLNGYSHIQGGSVSSFIRYNPTDNTFLDLSLTGAPGGYGMTMGYWNGKIYATTGNSTIYVYDIASNTWSNKTMSGYPGTLGIYGHSTVLNGVMYLQGGEPASTYLQNFYAYDIATNQCVAKSYPSSSTSGTYGPFGDLVNNGTDLFLCSLNGVQKYVIADNNWVTLSSVPACGRMCFVNSRLYMNTVEGPISGGYFIEFDLGSNTWKKVTTSNATSSTRGVMGALLTPSPNSNVIYSLFGGTSLNGSQVNIVYAVD